MIVPFLLGSPTDKEWAQKIIDVLDQFNVPSVVHVASAHKVPEKVIDLVNTYNDSAEEVVMITIAGRSNGLSGVTAGSSIHPVIACPPFKDKADYNVNIHSTLQMPSDTPVLTVLDPKNAALCAVKILAESNPELKERVRAHIEAVKAKF